MVNCTGHTFPVEKHVLQDQWRIDLDLAETKAAAKVDGFGATLDHLDEKTTTVLVIDDNPDAVHLIRRILEKKKNYRVFDANDGWDGLVQARQRIPDLIVLDLMMPKMDGFGVLENLKLDPRTAAIPVIVVSAKELTSEDWRRLDNQIEGLYQKGSLPTMDFVNQVVEVIEEKV